MPNTVLTAVHSPLVSPFHTLNPLRVDPHRRTFVLRFNAIARSFNLPLVFHLDMRLYNNDQDFSIPSLATIARRSLRHYPRGGTTSHGPRHSTVIIIAVSASVGGILLVLFFWRILSRRSARSRSAPFPQRQVLGHQRERQLVTFTEHQNASVPKILPDDDSRPPSAPYIGDSLRDSPNATSSSNTEVDETTGAAPTPSYGDQLHPPTPPFLTPHTSSNASSTSLPLSHGRSSPSSDGTLPPTAISPSPNQSLKRVANRAGSRQRPVSMLSIGTSRTIMSVRSRPSIRAAPHARHSNIQIVLPAPLAPNLYERPASEEPRMHRPSMVEGTYTDSWRTSMVDTWISAGQHDVPEPESIERQRSRDSVERRSRRLMRSTCVARLMILYA